MKSALFLACEIVERHAREVGANCEIVVGTKDVTVATVGSATVSFGPSLYKALQIARKEARRVG